MPLGARISLFIYYLFYKLDQQIALAPAITHHKRETISCHAPPAWKGQLSCYTSVKQPAVTHHKREKVSYLAIQAWKVQLSRYTSVKSSAITRHKHGSVTYL